MTRSRDTASIIPTVDAKGDLLVGTADNTIDNLSPGTNGQVLTANSATATGLEWKTVSATEPVTYSSTTQTVGLTDAFISQTVRSYANATARASAIPSPTEGMLTYLEDLDTYESYTGSAWVSALSVGSAVAFTPAWSGLTVGNGTYNRSHYTIAGKTVTVSVDFLLGSTTAVVGNLAITLPSVIQRASSFNTGVSQCILRDSSVTSFIGAALPNTSNASQWNIRGTGSSPVIITSTSSTAPFTWTTGDSIMFGATYEVA
jgi:hypothetical protein